MLRNDGLAKPSVEIGAASQWRYGIDSLGRIDQAFEERGTIFDLLRCCSNEKLTVAFKAY
jgi:hypothetical protein